MRVIFTRGSGCYGINGADTVSYDAALLSQAVGKPVRVQLSRKDEMAWENYGMAFAVDQRVGIDAAGTIVAWDYEGWSASLGGRPGYDRPGNVITGQLAGFETGAVHATLARARTRRLVQQQQQRRALVRHRLRRWTLRRRRHGEERARALAHREVAVLHRTAALAVAAAEHVRARVVHGRNRGAREGRSGRLSPAPPQRSALEACRAGGGAGGALVAASLAQGGLPRTGIASGRGLSCVAYEGDNGYVAMVAEVDVDLASGRVTARRFVVAQDCGPISNPDGMRNQIEGGALQGMSRALGEEVTWDDQKVTSIDWRTFHSLPLGFAIPEIESVLVNRTDVEATGAGETAITIVAAALGNAIFDATGARIREIPFTPERVKAALDARG